MFILERLNCTRVPVGVCIYICLFGIMLSLTVHSYMSIPRPFLFHSFLAIYFSLVLCTMTQPISSIKLITTVAAWRWDFAYYLLVTP